jgi:hypothetical protein
MLSDALARLGVEFMPERGVHGEAGGKHAATAPGPGQRDELASGLQAESLTSRQQVSSSPEEVVAAPAIGPGMSGFTVYSNELHLDAAVGLPAAAKQGSSGNSGENIKAKGSKGAGCRGRVAASRPAAPRLDDALMDYDSLVRLGDSLYAPEEALSPEALDQLLTGLRGARREEGVPLEKQQQPPAGRPAPVPLAEMTGEPRAPMGTWLSPAKALQPSALQSPQSHIKAIYAQTDGLSYFAPFGAGLVQAPAAQQHAQQAQMQAELAAADGRPVKFNLAASVGSTAGGGVMLGQAQGTAPTAGGERLQRLQAGDSRGMGGLNETGAASQGGAATRPRSAGVRRAPASTTFRVVNAVRQSGRV